MNISDSNTTQFSGKSIEQYLKILNPEQKQAVEHYGSPLLILAGAGSGKTRVITTKISYLINKGLAEPWQILAVTFTKKAANEMRQRAVDMEPKAEAAQIRTFHSFGSWFLRKFSDLAGIDSSFTVYDEQDMETLVKKAVPKLTGKEAKLVAHQISLAKDYCLTPEDDLTILASDFDINEIYKAYQQRLRATGNVDFGDLIMLPVLLMDSCPDIASYIHNRFKVIMVDEYQDSNIAQYKLLQKLSGIEQGNDCYVCVVGDDDQSIYHFRGAEVQNIISFPDKFPETRIIRLERNYRSTSKILEAASFVVSKNESRLGKTLIAERGEGGEPVLAYVPDAKDEAAFCRNLINHSLENGGKYSDWAILYRTNAQSLSFEKEFMHQKIPYVVVGSLKFFEREEVKDALAYLALCANPRDEISFRRIINKPSRGLGEKTQEKILEAAYENGVYKNLIEIIKKMAQTFSKKAKEGADSFVKFYENLAVSFNEEKNLSEFIQNLNHSSGLEEYHKASDEIEGTQRLQNLQELANSAASYKCTREGLTDFLDSINLDRTLELKGEEVAGDAVTLITLHNTKGLEYNNVIITGLEEGVFPRAGKTGAELEEERRLFYVGITRAKNQLYVTSAAQRVMYGMNQLMQPSKFISEAQEVFKVVGEKPRNNYGSYGYGGYGSSYGGYKKSWQYLNDDSSEFGAKSEIAEKWKKGTKVYNDDYGYGVVISCSLNDGEVVIEVQFENGGKKKYLPEYQKSALMIIKD